MKHLACTFAAAALAALVPDAASAQQQQTAPTFDGASRDAQAELEKSLAELSRLRERIASEKIPLTKSLSQLEGDLVKARQDYQQASSQLANRSLDLTTLTNEIKAREEEVAYLANLLGEYMRNFESGLHIAELQRFRKPLEDARLAAENDSLPRREVFEAQAKALMQSLERLHAMDPGYRDVAARVGGGKGPAAAPATGPRKRPKVSYL